MRVEMLSHQHRSFIALALVAVCMHGCTEVEELELEELELEELDLEELEPDQDMELANGTLRDRAACSKGGCNGLDPNVTGCDLNAKTLSTRNFAQGKLELRYSNTCETKWAKVTRNDGSMLSTAWVQTSDGTGKPTTIDTVVWSYMWSNMYYSNSMKACAIIYPCSGDCDANGTTYCTAYGTK